MGGLKLVGGLRVSDLNQFFFWSIGVIIAVWGKQTSGRTTTKTSQKEFHWICKQRIKFISRGVKFPNDGGYFKMLGKLKLKVAAVKDTSDTIFP